MSDDKRFVDELYTKPFDAWTNHEKNRLINISVRLQREVDAKQAEIDRLMLEFCPEEMSDEQFAEWGQHQAEVEAKDFLEIIDEHGKSLRERLCGASSVLYGGHDPYDGEEHF